MNRVVLNTADEYSAWAESATSEDQTTVLQVGSEACAKCPAFTSALSKLNDAYHFRWAYSDAHSDDADICEHFSITQLPAFVLQSPKSESPVVFANATRAQLEDAVRGACRPVLKLDEDF